MTSISIINLKNQQTKKQTNEKQNKKQTNITISIKKTFY